MRIGVILLLTSVLCPPVTGERPDPQRWEADIRAFEAQDRSQPPPAGAILFVGSSSIRLWNLPQSFPDRAVINRGFGGSHIADTTYYLDRIVTKHRPRTIVLYAGDNDIAHGLTPEQVVADYEACVSKIRRELPEVKIVFISIKPSRARWHLYSAMRQANQAIKRRIAEDPHAEFVDVSTGMLTEAGELKAGLLVADGLHLNERGYAVWAELVRPHLPKH